MLTLNWPVIQWLNAKKRKKEASVGVEPTMVDLQSTALATWLRRLIILIPSQAYRFSLLKPARLYESLIFVSEL